MFYALRVTAVLRERPCPFIESHSTAVPRQRRLGHWAISANDSVGYEHLIVRKLKCVPE